MSSIILLVLFALVVMGVGVLVVALIVSRLGANTSRRRFPLNEQDEKIADLREDLDDLRREVERLQQARASQDITSKNK